MIEQAGTDTGSGAPVSRRAVPWASRKPGRVLPDGWDATNHRWHYDPAPPGTYAHQVKVLEAALTDAMVKVYRDIERLDGLTYLLMLHMVRYPVIGRLFGRPIVWLLERRTPRG